jgi:homoserine dehydrogenase
MSSEAQLEAQEARTPAGGPVRETARVGLLGHGTVGSAFAALLKERAGQIERACGRPVAIGSVLTRSQGDFAQILAESEVIVELIGGIEPARSYALATLSAGKSLVTANKQLLCEHGEELFAAARASGAQLRFEAAVAGVIPVIRVLQESLAGAQLERVHGIVNGTTNYILSAMAAGRSYEQALSEAKQEGFAEADPSEDVSGKDAAAKMAILARLAFGVSVRLAEVPHEGIEHLQADDLLYARELGLSLKLIGTAERTAEGISVRVHPAFLYSGHPLASVSGPYNALTIESEAITEITMSGPGAGGIQTASAVLGDLLSVLCIPSPSPPEPVALPLLEDFPSAFYLHVEVADRPGVLAAVAGALGTHEVSLKSVLQRGLGENARLVMVTHRIARSRLEAALVAVSELEHVRSRPRAIPVIEEEFR